MISISEHQNMTERFISTQIVSRGLDERTIKAYQLDLEKFYKWLKTDSKNRQILEDNLDHQEEKICIASVSDKMNSYLNYLSSEKGLRQSTICRKKRVLEYYLSYLVSQGILEQYYPLKPITILKEKEDPVNMFLTKREVELFFRTIEQEYQELDSDFRKRICLRDQIMMKLLFYHGIEISELLRLEVMDYNWKTAILVIRGKREKNRSMYIFSRQLREQMKQWLSEHGYFERDDLYRNMMFLSKMGKTLSMKMVINIFDKYRVMAGIEKECKPKDLKRSMERYAKELVMERSS